jgi:hypothetical protein
MAARKLNALGEASSQSAWLNEPGRLVRIKPSLVLPGETHRQNEEPEDDDQA